MAAQIPALVQRMRGGSSRLVQLDAAKTLMQVMRGSSPEQKAAFVAAGGIEAAMQLLNSGVALQVRAAWLLGEACGENTDATDALVAAGGVAALLQLLQTLGAGGDPKALDAPLLALGSAAGHSAAARAAVIEAGGIPLLVGFLRSGELDTHTVGATAALLSYLAADNPAAVAASGAKDVLVRLLPHRPGAAHAPLQAVLQALVQLVGRSLA